MIQIKQAVAEHARHEASYRTRRGLEGRAIARQSTGGRAYDYTPARDSSTGQIEINEADAAVVRRIFEWYADGLSPRTIAARLNKEGVDSPGTRWNRTVRRRDRKWLASTIHGDVNRGTGILNNRRYVGIVLWGRSEWKRSAADSAKRKHRLLEKAGSERLDERLRIVSDELWARAKARQASQSRKSGELVKGGLRKNRAGAGPAPRYLLSGLLRCAACEANFVLSNGTRYQCATHVNGDACSVALSVPRARVESVIMECVQTDLLNPRKLAAAEQSLRSAATGITVDHGPRIAELNEGGFAAGRRHRWGFAIGRVVRASEGGGGREGDSPRSLQAEGTGAPRTRPGEP